MEEEKKMMMAEKLPPTYLVETGPFNFEGDTDNTTAQQSENEAAMKQSGKILEFVKEDWLRKQLKQREHEYTEFRNLIIFVGTWNVNGKKPSGSIQPWLDPGEGNPLPDLYVLGFQEIVDLNASAVVSDAGSKEKSQLWKDKILETLNGIAYQRQKLSPQGDANTGVRGLSQYKFLVERHLVGLMMCMFALDVHVPHIPRSSILTAQAATGMLGMIGNKGGISARLRLYDSELCFVCAHLAAHRENVESRNADFETIMAKTVFKDEVEAYVSTADVSKTEAYSSSSRSIEDQLLSPRRRANLDGNPSSGAGNGGDGTFGILDHDFVIWLGDFNYRIQVGHSDDTIFKHVTMRNFEWLVENDQLLIEKKAGKVFNGFIEAPISFLPTYKYLTGSMHYDRRPEKKVRPPAWCDRILWRVVYPTSSPEEDMKAIEYSSRDSLTISDHKPVIALLQARIKVRDKKRSHQVFQEVLRLLDHWENEVIPKVSLDKNIVTFQGGVKYQVPAKEHITISNNGQVPATWRFVPKLEDAKLTKDWLAVSPSFGLLIPGESITVELTGLVDAATARNVISGAETLDDILVLRLERGRDHYVSISAELLPTCFGVSLIELSRTPHPFRASPSEIEELKMLRSQELGPSAAKAGLAIPKELWRLFNFLWLYGGMQHKFLFYCSPSHPGMEEQRIIVRTCLDTGYEIPPPPTCSMDAAAATVIELFEAMPDPVIPFDMFPNVDLDSMSKRPWSARFLEQLPPLNHNTFVYTVTFLRELLAPENTAYNGLSANKLAPIFANCLMRPAEAAELAGGKSGLSSNSSTSSNTAFEFPSWITGDSSSQRQFSYQAAAEDVMRYFLSDDVVLIG